MKKHDWFGIIMTIATIAVFFITLPLLCLFIKLLFMFLAGLSSWLQLAIIILAVGYIFKTK